MLSEAESRNEKPTSLVTQDIQARINRLQSIELVMGIAGLNHLFQQTVETSNHAISQGKAVVARQTMEDRHIPFDQVVGFLNNR